MHAGEAKARVRHMGDHLVGKRLAFVQLHEGTLDEGLVNPGQTDLAATEHGELEPLDVDLQKAGAIPVAPESFIEGRHRDIHAAFASRAGEFARLDFADRQQRRRIVTGRYVHVGPAGGCAGCGGNHLDTAAENALDRVSRVRQRLETDDPRLGEELRRQQRKLTAGRAHIQDRANPGIERHVQMLNRGHDAMACRRPEFRVCDEPSRLSGLRKHHFRAGLHGTMQRQRAAARCRCIFGQSKLPRLPSCKPDDRSDDPVSTSPPSHDGNDHQPLRIQLWTFHYDPEPLGIGPLAGAWTREMLSRGHEVNVVAAHPHYPEARWGTRLRPYREARDGATVFRVPLRIGRKGKLERLAQEASFVASLSAVMPVLPPADVKVAVSPCFPALLPAIVDARTKRTPWVIWLQDILPDGAASTGYLERKGKVYRASRRLEDAAYRSADHIVVLSDSFRQNLIGKGVPGGKITLAYNPATFPAESLYRSARKVGDPPRILCMGNIGKSQNLPAIIEAFEASRHLEETAARLVIAGTGVAEDETRAAIRTDRVEMPGLLLGQDLVDELARADLGLVSQSYEGGEFNVPSKLMNYLAVGLPVVASVSPTGEVARILESSGAGWMTDRIEPRRFAIAAARALDEPEALLEKSLAGVRFAESNLMPTVLASTFEQILTEVAG